MNYTTSSPPILIGRPGYSAEHYDFAFSGLGDVQTDVARKANELAMAGEYRKAGALISGYSAPTQKYVLNYLKQSLPSARYQLVVKYVKPATEKREGGAGAAWSFIKGQLAPGTAAPGVSAAPNYLLWGGLAVGGVVLLMLLRRKPRAAPAPAK